MTSLIRYMDFTTNIQNFFYDGEYRYKTVIGGLIQILTTVLWLVGIIYFSKDIYLRENPSVISYNEYDRVPYQRNYTNLEDLMFMVSLNDPFTWAPFIDETYYTVKFITMSKVNQTKGPSELLKTERCKPEFFTGKESFLTGIPIEKYYCLSPEVKNVTFKGTQTSPDSKYIKIGVHMCMNTTENNNFCKTPDEITNKLAGSSFNLFFFNYKFNSKNYTDPDEHFIDFHHSFYSNSYYKLVFVTLKQVRFIDDVGFFFESLYSHDYYAVNDIKEVFNFQKQPDGKFLDFAVNFGTNRENVRRNYKRIQSVLAEVGGLFKAIFLSVLIVRVLFMNVHTFQYLNYFLQNDKVFGVNYEGKISNDFGRNKKKISKIENLRKEKFVEKILINTNNDLVTNTQNNLLTENHQLNKANIFTTNTNNDILVKNTSTTNILKNLNDKNLNLIKKSKFDINSASSQSVGQEINKMSQDPSDNFSNNMELINIKNNLKSNANNNPKVLIDNSNLMNNTGSNEKNIVNNEEGKNLNKNIVLNLNSKYSKIQANNKNEEDKKIQKTFNMNINNFDKLKRKNNSNLNEKNKKFPKNFEVLARNYLSQKELLKLVTDFSLLRSIIFDDEQNIEFEEMSRNLALITKVMIEKELILSRLLNDSDNNIINSEKIDNSNAMLRLNEIY